MTWHDTAAMDLQQIGAGHPRIKQVLDLAHNTTANRHRLFVAEGLWAHTVLLESGVDVEAFLWCPEAAGPQAQRCAEQIAARAARSYRISMRTLERVAERDRPDGLVSVARMPRWEPEALAIGESALVLVADAIEIPGNLGTLIRTLDACRADCLILTNRRTRLTHPKVFRGSHGASVRVPIIEFDEPSAAVGWLRERGFRVFLADAAGALHYRRVDLRGRLAFVTGNERHGISKPFYGYHFPRVTVPVLGRGDSLNVSISAAILLYEARAQQDGW